MPCRGAEHATLTEANCASAVLSRRIDVGLATLGTEDPRYIPITLHVRTSTRSITWSRGKGSPSPAPPVHEVCQSLRVDHDPVLAHYRHFFLPQSSSASRFTAGASEFFILSQSGERPDR
jgi:hypothetical protein